MFLGGRWRLCLAISSRHNDRLDPAHRAAAGAIATFPYAKRASQQYRGAGTFALLPVDFSSWRGLHLGERLFIDDIPPRSFGCGFATFLQSAFVTA